MSSIEHIEQKEIFFQLTISSLSWQIFITSYLRVRKTCDEKRQ